MGSADGGTGRARSNPPIRVLESCHSTWIFDTRKKRFRRGPRDADVDTPVPDTEWTPYVALELDRDSEGFVVVLNKERTRLLRSWRHVENCDQCGAQATDEMRLDELRDMLDE